MSFDGDYSAGYSGDGRLIVCAVVCGKVYHCEERRDGGKLEPGFDSHVAGDGKEWVLFENSQVLPLLVIEDKDTPQLSLDPPPKAVLAENPPEPPPIPPAIVVCAQCLKSFKSMVALSCHQNNLGHSQWPAPKTQCKYCHKKCKSEIGLEQHLATKQCQSTVEFPWKTVK